MEKQKNQKKETSAVFWERTKYMLATSVGRLPTSLVVLLLISMAFATVTGLVMQLTASTERSVEFMALRLTPDEDTAPIDPKKLQGTWIYQTPDYAMTLTFIGQQFEWIILFKDISEAQFFARGDYRVEGDVMILGIRTDLGQPGDPTKPWLKYMPIGMRDLNTRISMPGRGLLWDVPSSEQRKILSQTARIFLDHPDGHFEWVRQ